jgi:hypothetical protein
MIRPGEIQLKANTFGVRDQQIEMDYILSWILFGLSKHEKLSKQIIFKGGTALKKIYFEDYRFSEDLDFTLLNPEIPNTNILFWFEEIFAILKEEANIPLEILDNNEHEDGGINFYIRYIGPLGGQGQNKRVKVDISRREQLVFEPVIRDVFIDYSDQEEFQIACYSLEEILVEKLRSVMQRMQARDFYDIWYLLAVQRMDAGSYLMDLEAKCRVKNLLHSDFPKKLDERLPQYKARWQSSLKEQIKDLPDYERVERELMRLLKKIRF